jgi:formylglycine-generating enzyme required for sulfatase activity
MNLHELLRQTYANLLTLQEREARYGGQVPLELLNQITDHHQAIELIERALSVPLTEAGLKELKEALRPMLLASNVESINLDELKLDIPPLTYEPETIFIPAGRFLMGSPPGPEVAAEETPQHEVNLPAYRIAKYPVTNLQYAEFLKWVKHIEPPKKVGWFSREPPAAKVDHPVVGVSWDEAQAYGRWLSEQTGRSYRLPSEAEWEKASRGKDGRRYPWGEAWLPGCCNVSSDDTTSVTAYPAGASPYGCCDMVGNVQEWTSTLWGSDLKANVFPYPYRPEDGREDLKASHLYRVYRVYRGGSFRDEPSKLSCTARGASTPDSKIRWRGFRVVQEV